MSTETAAIPAETTPPTPRGAEPARSRAVFSTADFELLRTAVLHYLREIQDTPESISYANLYHRLGRLG